MNTEYFSASFNSRHPASHYLLLLEKQLLKMDRGNGVRAEQLQLALHLTRRTTNRYLHALLQAGRARRSGWFWFPVR